MSMPKTVKLSGVFRKAAELKLTSIENRRLGCCAAITDAVISFRGQDTLRDWAETHTRASEFFRDLYREPPYNFYWWGRPYPIALVKGKRFTDPDMGARVVALLLAADIAESEGL